MENSEFIERSRKIHGHKYDYSLVEYCGSKTKVKIICPDHGIFLQTPNNHINGRKGCKKCFYDYKRKSVSDFIKEAREVHGNKYDYSLAKYTHNQCKIKIICKIHGVFEQFAFSHIKQGSGCPKCNVGFINKCHTIDEFINRASVVHGDKYDYSVTNYIRNDVEVAVRCKKHGIFMQLPNNHLSGSGCNKCFLDKARMTVDDFVYRSNHVHNNEYNYELVDYVNIDTKIDIICKKHGKFSRTPYSHLSGYGCPICYNNISKGHREIYEYIGLDGIINDRSAIKPLEIDCYYPDHNIGIEFHGVYYHSSFNNNDRLKHSNKLDACNNVGIKLIQIFENEWYDKKDIVKSIIEYNFGRIKHKYSARKCTVSSIPFKDYEVFCDNNHLQGCVGCKVRYGLFFNDDLVGVMGFNKHHKYEWEISRFCVKVGCLVNGGASKLFSHFINDNNPNNIMTYADRRYSNGSIYKRLGFVVDSITKPGYFYTKNTSVFSRQSFQKHKLSSKISNFDSSLTEFENMINNGYKRLWDAGNIRLLWRKI